ncbi:MAG: hypothetical protein RJA44_726 [Pseudomonadota bacterium]
MAFASFERRTAGAPLSEINMVPLIDVMLVLLVIFIVTAPLLSHSVRLQLPQASSQPRQPEPERIEFSIDASGQRYWNGHALSRSEAAVRFKAASAAPVPPTLQLRVDRAVVYQHVAETLADASTAGLTRIGFVSQPGSP